MMIFAYLPLPLIGILLSSRSDLYISTLLLFLFLRKRSSLLLASFNVITANRAKLLTSKTFTLEIGLELDTRITTARIGC